MAPPSSSDFEEWNQRVVLKVIAHVFQSKGNVMIHCRGGIGRAGMLGCNILSHLLDTRRMKESAEAAEQKMKGAQFIIDIVRRKRDRRAVESQKQVDFVFQFHQYLLN
mmetsp:Transcript_17607/g.29728  ORF Transcript_17607/g.29728 Transcript_17607/m.29728 type:complete len:108 (-) Transcript_17607:3-326(-)